MGKHSTLTLMRLLVDGGVGIELVLGRWESGVELRFLDVGVWAVDGLETGVGVYGEGIRAEAVELAVFLVLAVEFEMSVTVVGVVELVKVCDFCEEWAWVLGEGVEVKSVYYEDECINNTCTHSSSKGKGREAHGLHILWN